MKIETDENTSIAATISILAICLTVGCIGGCHIVETNSTAQFKAATDAGLVQQPDHTYTTHWVKP